MAAIQRWIAAIFIFGSPGLAILILLVAAPRLTSDRPGRGMRRAHRLH
jgi:hypothetical protein